MSDLIRQLESAVEGSVTTDADAMEAYRRDQCLLAEPGRPLAVVKAASVADVQAVVRLAGSAGVPVVTRGAGTGLAGAANALDGGIVLVVAGLDQILEIDPLARTARVQPGVINAHLDRAAAEHGLWYAPDPGSRDISSLGGNLATNAGGMCCAKYGTTADHVLELTVVDGSGDVLHLGRATRKNVAGLDLTRLVVGSEGTLGIIVEATLRLRPRPAGPAVVAGVFPDVASAVSAVLEAGARVEPAAAELMDRATIRAVNAMTHMGLDEEAGAVLLAQFDGATAAADAAIFSEVADGLGGETFHTADPVEGEGLMAARRAALPAIERLGATLLDDVCVPVPQLPALVEAIARIAAAHRVEVPTFGHAADGNLHPTVVFDAADPASVAAARAAFDDILAAAQELGGTISGEHGIGGLKLGYLDDHVGAAERALMHRVKAAFDPLGILNPGRGY
ncbi:D-lactate dehydrogenase (cytochrome)/glycolate oxidase [Nocardioides luteus]|uniref:FAD-binding oxidoreductase n=1 Tax=Nocardioides luteus TaxID=1844 RepID=UPI002855A977|nr:FAD-linked oxidase C-terminal domain-containing protein [Nocardioides luteus]MDR7311295.1 D-lactate dehydrogenase (cytochrome)/glycolate oxidase [Nocardioides luteus]